MAKSSEYWKKRFEQIEQSQNQQGVQCYAEIEKQYRQAQKQLEGQIASWYQRFATNNKITLAEAHRLLTSDELAEFKWDVNQYIQYGEENAINGTWCKQLENASVRFHINRLEALKIQTQQAVEVLFGNQLDTIDDAMKGIYTSGYYHTAFEIQKGVGVGWDFATLDDKQISKVINKPWSPDGKNFSERVWTNRQKLVNELNTTLTQNIVLGKDPQKAIDEISRKMKTSKNVAGRLVMTEEAAFSSAAQKDCFTELDVEQFEIVATLDSHTSEICQDMDGKHFPMSQWEVGTTAPPFHVYCRSTTVPFFDDEFDNLGERAARNADGETYYVPADTTYSDWKKGFVDGDKSGLQPVKEDDTMKLKNKIADADTQISDLKKQFSDITEGYSYDDWFRDFKTIEDGYGDISESDEPNVLKLKDIQQKVKDLLQKKTGWKSQLPVLGGQGTPMNITDALKGANPNYARGTQYGVNCQRCVQTYELRRRGYDVEALPKPKSNNSIVWGNECFVDSSGNTPSFTFNQSEKDIKTALANAPDGSRHVIYAAWSGSRSAHVFIAEKENGIIRYVDPQPNKDNVEHYFSLAKKNKFGILRVDDKNITSDTSKLSATVRW
jgi:SPP1 gp7 family putative phage head morphogenesis protein